MQVGLTQIAAPLNLPSLLGSDASLLYAKNQYNLLALMLKDNILKIDWSDEVLSKTALTHDGKLQDTEDPKKDEKHVAQAAAKRPKVA